MLGLHCAVAAAAPSTCDCRNVWVTGAESMPFAAAALCRVHVTPLSAAVISAAMTVIHAQQPWIAAWARARCGNGWVEHSAQSYYPDQATLVACVLPSPLLPSPPPPPSPSPPSPPPPSLPPPSSPPPSSPLPRCYHELQARAQPEAPHHPTHLMLRRRHPPFPPSRATAQKVSANTTYTFAQQALCVTLVLTVLASIAAVASWGACSESRPRPQPPGLWAAVLLRRWLRVAGSDCSASSHSAGVRSRLPGPPSPYPRRIPTLAHMSSCPTLGRIRGVLLMALLRTGSACMCPASAPRCSWTTAQGCNVCYGGSWGGSYCWPSRNGCCSASYAATSPPPPPPPSPPPPSPL